MLSFVLKKSEACRFRQKGRSARRDAGRIPSAGFDRGTTTPDGLFHENLSLYIIFASRLKTVSTVPYGRACSFLTGCSEKARAADAKEVGVEDPAEETICSPDRKSNWHQHMEVPLKIKGF